MAKSRHGYQRAHRPNPAMAQMQQQKRIENQLKEAYNQGVRQGIILDKIIAVQLLRNAGSGAPITEYMEAFDKYRNAVIFDELTTVRDIIDQLKEAEGFTLTDEDIIEAIPEIASYLPESSKEEENTSKIE